tara:strand:+ start:1604 stop:2569 length:966 start_codon:yes stop_codon:yes gene_type:complete
MAVVAVAVAAVGIALYAVTRTAEIPGQKLGNIAQQTAKEGEPRQIVFGIGRPLGGNIVAVQEPPRIERRKQKSGGKGGGGGSSSTVEVPRRTYAVGISEGPVTGIRRAWRNNKLVYDGRGTEWGAKNNGTFLSRFQFYLGDWDQMPSPNLEAVFGAGNVPAMRGTCYMVAKDEDLQDTGGAVPQWIFEVERAYGHGLTSRPYPIEVIESAKQSGGGLRVPPTVEYEELILNTGGSLAAGEFKALLQEYSIIEDLDQLGGSIESGIFKTTLNTYSSTEVCEVTGGAIETGVFKVQLIKYLDWPAEAGEVTSGEIKAGNHETA